MKKVFTDQGVLTLMGFVRNLFAVNAGQYSKTAEIRKKQINKAFDCWNQIATQVLCAYNLQENSFSSMSIKLMVPQ